MHADSPQPAILLSGRSAHQYIRAYHPIFHPVVDGMPLAGDAAVAHVLAEFLAFWERPNARLQLSDWPDSAGLVGSVLQEHLKFCVAHTSSGMLTLLLDDLLPQGLLLFHQ